jgi:hypothetical protein
MSDKLENATTSAQSECNGLLCNISEERLNSFHPGQVWMTPRGFLYKVISVQRGYAAVLRSGADGSGRKKKRDWDAVINWRLYSDT